MEAIHRGEIKGLLSICFNPLVSLPDADFTREALEKLEFFGVVDFFLSETAQHADVVLAGSLQEEEEGVVCSAEGRVIHIQQGGRPARRRARTTGAIYLRAGAPAGQGRSTSRTARRARSSTSCARPRAAAPPTTTASPTRRSTARWASSGPARARTIPARRASSRAAASSIPTARRASSSPSTAPSGDPVDEDFPIYLTTGRVVSQYLSGTQTRRIGPLVDQYPEPRVEIHPRLAETLGIADGDWVTVTTRRDEITLQALVVRTIRPDTVFIPYHWPGGAAPTASPTARSTRAARSPSTRSRPAACEGRGRRWARERADGASVAGASTAEGR